MANIDILNTMIVRKKKKKPVEEGAFVDMVAFAALMTILLAFFIMLSSNVGPVNEKDAKEAIDSFKEALDHGYRPCKICKP